MQERMYYYTSTDTMRKILQSGNMFATNLNYMNDAQEYINGLEEIRKLCLNEEFVRSVYSENKDGITDRMIKALENEMTKEKLDEYKKSSTRYSISFCKDGDLLSQWTTYARESGVSIEMSFEKDKNVCFKFYNAGPGAQEIPKIECFARPREILYLTKQRGGDYKKTGEKVLRRMFPEGYQEGDTDTKLAETWKENSVYIKQYDFYQEKEYRIAFDYMKLNEEAGWPRIDYRTEKHVIKPYLDVECEKGWPIISVMVGPGFNQQVVYRSVKFFLDHAQIRSSKLYTRKQWGEQIGQYLKEVMLVASRELMLNEQMVDKRDEKGGEFLDIFKFLIEDSSCDNKIEQSERSKLYEMVNELSRMFFLKLEERGNESVVPYFSKSGIILKCSQIPYIY